VQHFQQGYGGTNLTQEVAHHSAHCFDYIRQALMCAGDTTLEGKTAAGMDLCRESLYFEVFV
jgi:hypothetical protein